MQLDQLPVDLVLDLARPHAGSEPLRALFLAAGSLWSLHKYRGLLGRIRRLEDANLRNMNVTWKGSPSYTKNRYGKKPVKVIVHWMAGNLAGTDAHFGGNNGVSAHFGVEGSEVHQYVKLEDAAWHAGGEPAYRQFPWQQAVSVHNLESVGIEFSAQPGRALTDEGYATGSALIADVCRRLGIEPTLFTVLPHKAFRPTQCPGTVDVPRLVTGAREILYPQERVLATVRVPVFVDTLEDEPKGPNGYPQATVRRYANVRSRIDRVSPGDVTEVLSPGTVQDVEGVVAGTKVDGNGLWFRKPNGLYLWTGTTDYKPN